MDELETLVELIKTKNDIDSKISQIIGRPGLQGHIGEFIAGKNANVKLYGKRESILDFNPKDPAEYYLVLTGPKSSTASSRGTNRPLIINSVFLFESGQLIKQLKERNVKIGNQVSITQEQWNDAEIFPNQRNNQLPVTEKQKELLRLFQ